MISKIYIYKGILEFYQVRVSRHIYSKRAYLSHNPVIFKIQNLF